MSHFKAVFHELNNVLNSKPFLESEGKRRGRPRKKENSSIVKELQKVLQKIHKVLKEEHSKPNYSYNTNTDVFQQAIDSFERVFSDYKDVADVIKKATDCLNYIVKIIIYLGLLKKSDDNNDWEKIVVDLLSLIENFIQQEDADRETLGKLCLRPLIETLKNSSLPTVVRKTSADVINAFLTGCKENKKLLSQENFFNISDLVSSMIFASDYELQLLHLEILFRLCPRMQEDREIFVDKAFMTRKDLIQRFLAITVNDFFGDTRCFLNSLNEQNDGISKTPKTFTASQIKYNHIELYFPKRQDCFFIDFNKWTISAMIKSTEGDDSVDNDVLEIKYSKILTWDHQVESEGGYLKQDLRLYLSEHLKLDTRDSTNLHNKRIFSTTNEIIIFIRFDEDVKDDLEMIFTDRRVKKKIQLSKIPLPPMPEASRTPENQTIDKQIKLLKDANLDHELSSFDSSTGLANISQNCIATYNTELSLTDSLPESQRFKNTKITPSTSPYSNRPHTRLMQILDAEQNGFLPLKQRSKSLNLSTSKKQRTNNEVKLSDMVKKVPHQILQIGPSKQNASQNKDQDGDFMTVEQSNDTANIAIKSHVTENRTNLSEQNIAEFRLLECPKFPNAIADKNIKNNIDHGKGKRKKDLSEDELGNSRFKNIVKKNKFHKKQIKVNSPIKSEEEFWNPSKHDATKYDAEDDDIEQMRAQFPMEFFRELVERNSSIPKPSNKKKQVSFVERLKGFSKSLDSKDNDENTLYEDQYVPHTRESSLTISSSNETTTPKNVENISLKNCNDECSSNKYADEKIDEEIRRLLQCVGETIFRKFRSQDTALFQSSKKAIIQNESSLTRGLETQFKRMNELLNEFKRNCTSIAAEDRQVIKRLKEGRKELASLEQLLIEMERN